MITINVTFEGDQEEKLVKLKEKSGLSWHDFILVSSGAIKRKDLWKIKVKED
jgi:hypothetical protein